MHESMFTHTAQKSHYPPGNHHAGWHSGNNQILGHQYWWFAGDYDLQIGHI